MKLAFVYFSGSDIISEYDDGTPIDQGVAGIDDSRVVDAAFAVADHVTIEGDFHLTTTPKIRDSMVINAYASIITLDADIVAWDFHNIKYARVMGGTVIPNALQTQPVIRFWGGWIYTPRRHCWHNTIKDVSVMGTGLRDYVGVQFMGGDSVGDWWGDTGFNLVDGCKFVNCGTVAKFSTQHNTKLDAWNNMNTLNNIMAWNMYKCVHIEASDAHGSCRNIFSNWQCQMGKTFTTNGILIEDNGGNSNRFLGFETVDEGTATVMFSFGNNKDTQVESKSFGESIGNGYEQKIPHGLKLMPSSVSIVPQATGATYGYWADTKYLYLKVTLGIPYKWTAAI